MLDHVGTRKRIHSYYMIILVKVVKIVVQTLGSKNSTTHISNKNSSINSTANSSKNSNC